MSVSYIDKLIGVYESILAGSITLTDWLFTPIGVLGFTPIMLFTAGGLLAYLTIAIIKWVFI